MGRPAGLPKTGGRARGTPNKATADIKNLARKHGPAAVAKLVKLMDSDEEDIQLRASNALLDRGYGRPAQAITGEDGNAIVINLVERRIVKAEGG